MFAALCLQNPLDQQGSSQEQTGKIEPCCVVKALQVALQ